MNIDFFNPGFLVPAILSVVMLCIPVAVLTSGHLTFIETFIASLVIYSLIIVMNISFI